MGEQAEKSWKQKSKFKAYEDDFLTKIGIWNTTKNAIFRNLLNTTFDFSFSVV